MNYRDQWLAIMHYGEFDRMPVVHWAGWHETTERWRREGLPADVSEHVYFDAVPMWAEIGANVNLYPHFDTEVLEETDEYLVSRTWDGIVQKDWKHKSCIPNFIDFTLKTAADWPEYKKRLQPDPARIPQDLDEQIRGAEESGNPIRFEVASHMGWIRNWMGVENMSYLMYDDLDCYAEMVMTLADLTCWGMDQVIPRMTRKPDFAFAWEDICGKNGPLVSPDIFRRCVAPGYETVRSKLDEHGITLFGIDSDGFVEPLVKCWLDAGVNMQFPVEYGTWGATAEDLRRKFGKELRVFGGFNKLALEKGRNAIDAEVRRNIPLMKEGGFVLMPDHLITPGVPLDDYIYYLDQVRSIRL